MAVRTIFVDDLDGSTDDVQTCQLTWQDVTVEVDLSAEHREEITAALTPALNAGRAVRRPSSSAGRAPAPRPSRAEQAHRRKVREWAAAAGVDVPKAGPIPVDVEAKYAAAKAAPAGPAAPAEVVGVGDPVPAGAGGGWADAAASTAAAS